MPQSKDSASLLVNWKFGITESAFLPNEQQDACMIASATQAESCTQTLLRQERQVGTGDCVLYFFSAQPLQLVRSGLGTDHRAANLRGWPMTWHRRMFSNQIPSPWTVNRKQREPDTRNGRRGTRGRSHVYWLRWGALGQTLILHKWGRAWNLFFKFLRQFKLLDIDFVSIAQVLSHLQQGTST